MDVNDDDSSSSSRRRTKDDDIANIGLPIIIFVHIMLQKSENDAYNNLFLLASSANVPAYLFLPAKGNALRRCTMYSYLRELIRVPVDTHKKAKKSKKARKEVRQKGMNRWCPPPPL